MASRYWYYFGGFVLTSILLLGTGLMGIVDTLSVLSGGAAAGEGSLLVAMLVNAAEWLVIMTVLGLLALVFLLATVVSVIRTKAPHRNERVASLVERLEDEYPTLRELDISEKVKPTTEEREQKLRDQYVAGDLTDEEFERELDQLLEEETSNRKS